MFRKIQTLESLRCRHPGAARHLFLPGLFFPNVSTFVPSNRVSLQKLE